MRRSLKVGIAVAAAVAILGPLGFFWQQSLIPGTYDMATMGYADFGGGAAVGHAHGTGGLSVDTLTGPTSGKADVAVTLTARKETNGRYTLNGTSPGPEIRAVKGQLVEVTLVNDNVGEGVTLHWHGVDVPNGEDGVAGVTQDAVRPGKSFVYRFTVQDAGTYWYHSHQVGHEQVRQGLFGALIVSEPVFAEGFDQVVQVHTFDGRRTINGVAGVSALTARPSQVVRARVINTDAGPLRAWVSGAAYRVVAIDGRSLSGPTDITGKSVIVTAGGRIDLTFEMPADGVARVDVGAGAALVAGGAAAGADPGGVVDFLTYGSSAELGFDPAKATRNFDYRIGRRAGFLNGKPGYWWSINGHLFPDVPMFMVATGDIVRMTISNTSGEVHPMHLHGHHAVVLSRNGVAATGSPWWFDSLDVGDGETYEIAFVADNPGIWVDHCHNLQHAVDGLLAHLAYTNVTTPFRVGGKAGNNPE
ncbi:multicopper oxidase family protein [Paractinoplanes durhamensis]|uniref:Copper oxidase n=2 Tax=Paractinoplanes durhamensis TaxID=113563 RepID=A0ABQ3Z9U5_9ACTN|nr:multicopper oxidase family protein [Actinoplanes durhamensis]GIE06585.1 copper oxidase [Actinoplanes durhamensis]